MANLISSTTGNFTAAGSWGVVDATSLQNSAANNTTLTTSYVESSTFTPGAITIDGFAVRVRSRAGSPSGTMSIRLAIAGVTVTGTEVIINVSDLPFSSGGDIEWVFLKFAAPVLLIAATVYTLSAKTSAGSQINLYRDATANNWSRMLRTTTTQTPVAADVMFVLGDHISVGSTADVTITMNETATTDYGAGTANIDALSIGPHGVLTYGTTASTNYYLKLSGNLGVYASGILNIGTTGTPIPRTSTAVLEFDPAADGDMGLVTFALSTVNIQGLSRTSGKNVVACKLNTDEAANSTSLGVDTDTGWLDNDQIVVASTTRTATQSELGTMNGDAGASTLTVDGFAGTAGGLLNAHSGTSPTQAELINLTRNIKIRSATSTIMAYVYAALAATIDIDWAELYYIGENAANKRGIEIATTTGSFSMQFSSIHDTEDFGIYLPGSTGNNIIVSNNVGYNLNSVAGASTSGILITATSGTSITFDTNIFITITAPNTALFGGVTLQDVGITFTNNTIVGVIGGTTTSGLSLNESNTIGTISGNTMHSSSGNGIGISGANLSGVVSTTKCWRNTQTGIVTLASSGGDILWDTLTLTANGNNIIISGSFIGTWIYRTGSFNGDASFSTSAALQLNNTASGKHVFLNCNSGNLTAHTSADIVYGSTNSGIVEAFNTLFASTSETTAVSTFAQDSYFRSSNHDNSATTHKALYKYGTIAADQTTRHTASGFSWKMTPNSATEKLRLPGPYIDKCFRAAVNASSLVTITAYFQKDGSYNGNAPRLVLFGGCIGGVTSDVVASMAGGASSWEQLTVTATPNELGVVEYYMDCDGTAGNVYIDDITVTQA